jgi:hypothetical protein
MITISLPASDLLSGYEIDELNKLMADVIIYDYHIGDYCGDGHMLVFKNGLWSHHDMGHCSCNGPLEGLADSMQIPLTDDITKLRGTITQELYDEILPLVDIAIKETDYLKSQVPNKYQVLVTRCYTDRIDVWTTNEEAAKVIAQHQVKLLAENFDERLSGHVEKTIVEGVYKYDLNAPAASGGGWIKTIQV